MIRNVITKDVIFSRDKSNFSGKKNISNIALNMLFEILFSIFLVCVVGFILLLLKLDGDLTLSYYDYLNDISGKLKNKVIWITGASSGLGEHLAYELSKHGSKIVLSGTSEERLNKVKSKCKEIGVTEEDIFVLPFNIADYNVHEECVQKVVQKFQRIDILVNNAGRSQRAKFEEIDVQVDKDLFEINVFGTLNLTRKLLPHFLANRGGQFAVTSSCVGKMGAAFSASYTGSKHALHGYFETLRTETSGKNIDVTMLCPGPIFSHFLENAFTATPGQKFGEPTCPTDRRMPTNRCGRLMAVAIAHKLDEAWICQQPNLLLFYLTQYTPTFFRKVIVGKLYTPERAEKLREGRW